jgi:hypothetical protein
MGGRLVSTAARRSPFCLYAYDKRAELRRLNSPLLSDGDRLRATLRTWWEALPDEQHQHCALTRSLALAPTLAPTRAPTLTVTGGRRCWRVAAPATASVRVL